ncbi:hypothetical protein MASSI9I_90523 [Massilia sp. 9I]|nr:hypothetical protein MASSI9I_90523 [Massilia sp. 9I]
MARRAPPPARAAAIRRVAAARRSKTHAGLPDAGAEADNRGERKLPVLLFAPRIPHNTAMGCGRIAAPFSTFP